MRIESIYRFLVAILLAWYIAITALVIWAAASQLLHAWLSFSRLSTLTVTGVDRAAVERTRREIEAFDTATKTHEKAVNALASWYGIPFDGRTAADGSTYDRWALTCAALDYPLGTWLRLTNPQTHRWVIVRVTDRGPYIPGRSIDLSERAALDLGIHRQGVAEVEVVVLEGRP